MLPARYGWRRALCRWYLCEQVGLLLVETASWYARIGQVLLLGSRMWLRPRTQSCLGTTTPGRMVAREVSSRMFRSSGVHPCSRAAGGWGPGIGDTAGHGVSRDILDSYPSHCEGKSRQ